jgi:hypothetical protein
MAVLIDHLHGDAAIDLRMAVVQDSGTQFVVGQITGVARRVAASCCGAQLGHEDGHRRTARGDSINA